MALLDFKFFSEALVMQTEAYVILPQRSLQGEIGMDSRAKEGRYKCLYLLHGLSDDQSIWLRRTSIERYAADYGICVVMPCGHRSFYTDMKYGGKYYTYIAQELPRIITEFFNVSDRREDNYIAGLSMGGYGALKIGLRECSRFSAAAGLSSVADIRQNDFTDTKRAIWGDNSEIPEEDDLFYLARKNSDNPDRPRIFMGIGTEDEFYESNARLRKLFESLDYDYTYRQSAGGHGWKFWDEYIQYVLQWLFTSKYSN